MGRLVDPSRVRLHVADLRAYGISYRAIAHMAGMDNFPQLMGILRDAKQIRWETERRILRVRFDLDEMPPDAQLFIVGSRRRLQALVALGWQQQVIAQKVGLSKSNMGKLMHYGVQRYITAATAKRIRDVYQELALTPGTDKRARLLAQRRGWPSPWAWDDDTIDHPDTKPHEIERVQKGRGVPSTERAEEVEWYLDNVDHLAVEADLCARFGVGQGAIYLALKRADRQDLVEVLHANAEWHAKDEDDNEKEHAA